MKRAFAIIASLLAACAVPMAAWAQSASQQLRIIVPYPPGGTTDLIARLTAHKLGELTGQQSIRDVILFPLLRPEASGADT